MAVEFPPRNDIKLEVMGKEIERKYLVINDSYREQTVSSVRITQGYISRRKEGTVRVRIFGNRGFITVKSPTRGIERCEWEYEIPAEDAREMLSTVCEPGIIDKTRHIIDYQGFRWEVDEFHGPLAPLVLAEVELPDSSVCPPIPPFIGEEVSDNPAYFNSNLLHP